MIWLLVGLVLWFGSHLFKRLAPEMRSQMSDQGAKGLVSLASFGGIALMVIGYRGWDAPELWSPPAFLTLVNNLFMLLAVYLLVASSTKPALARMIRHPMLGGVKVWAFAHLLVNGDLASVVLFGGLLLWSVASMLLINRAEPEWQRPGPSSAANEAKTLVLTAVIVVVIGYVHNWLGYWPFG